MKNANGPWIWTEIKDLKCDNPNCDHYEEANIADYSELLNKPCPVCCEPLLTERDMKTVGAILQASAVFNLVGTILGFHLWNMIFKGKKRAPVHMDGTGRADIGEWTDDIDGAVRGDR
jgi:hypothetical protein